VAAQKTFKKFSHFRFLFSSSPLERLRDRDLARFFDFFFSGLLDLSLLLPLFFLSSGVLLRVRDRLLDLELDRLRDLLPEELRDRLLEPDELLDRLLDPDELRDPDRPRFFSGVRDE